MRILMVTHSFPRAEGDIPGSFILRLARSLADGGDVVHVLAPSAPGFPPTADIEGIAVTRFRYAPRSRETLAYTGTMAEQVQASVAGKVALAGMLAAGAIAVRNAVLDFQPDVVHAHWWFPAGVMALGACVDTPLVTTMHGSDVRLARSSRWGSPLFRRVMRRSAAVTAVSGWLASEARALLPELALSVEPMPVDVKLFAPSDDLEVRDARRLLFVGRLNAQKGLDLLLDALAATASGAALDVVGEGDDRAGLDARARALGLASRVRWHGALPQQQLVPLYRKAAALVLPGEHEGLGLVAVEAQLCETPVIAARSGGLTDIVTHGETGLLVPPRNAGALAAAIDDLLTRPDRGAALGRKGRAGALARFAPAHVAARYRDIYAKSAQR